MVKIVISSWGSELLATEERACAQWLRDGKANSKNVVGAREPNVHVHIIFRFETVEGNKRFCSNDPQSAYTAETSQQQAQLTDNWRSIDLAGPQGLKRP